MANSKSALKRVRQTEKRTLRNKSVKSRLKTQTRKVRRLIGEKDKDNARQAYVELVSQLDKAAKAGIIHQNKADRKKSQYNEALVKLT